MIDTGFEIGYAEWYDNVKPIVATVPDAPVLETVKVCGMRPARGSVCHNEVNGHGDQKVACTFHWHSKIDVSRECCK